MEIISLFLKEMENEAATTRKMLSIIPADAFDWRPHPKSMTIRHLAGHIAELPSWASLAINSNELDFAVNKYEEPQVNTVAEVLEIFEQSLAAGKAALESVTEDELLPDWTLRNGDIVYVVTPKHEMIRTAFCQIVHHRAQLGVYLRLLDVPIPGSYGPSADEKQVYDTVQA